MAMRTWNQTAYVDITLQHELRPAFGRVRSYLLILNESANDIYVNEGSMANSTDGTKVASGQNYELSVQAPSNTIYISGSQAAGARQKVTIKEGYR